MGNAARDPKAQLTEHHLSRRFSTPLPDKFDGVDCCSGAASVPLEGTIGRFLCRNVRQYDGGNHLIFIGEVGHDERFGGEPLVFHSGFYRVATRHPELAE